MPPEYQAELARLQDGAPPVPAADIFDTISTAFGCRVESVFADFDVTPLAAASIGQVHAATLVDGSDVVVKIRRPGVVAQVDEDLELLNRFAMRVAQRSETARHYDVAGLAAEFGGTLRQELDYLREGRMRSALLRTSATIRRSTSPACIGKQTSRAGRHRAQPTSTCTRGGAHHLANGFRARLLPRRPAPRQLFR